MLAETMKRADELAAALSAERSAAADAFAEAVAAELQGLGMGDGEFRADVERSASPATRAGTRSPSSSARTRAAVRPRRRDGLRR